MQYFQRVCALLMGAMPLLIGGAARGQEGINLRITNDGIVDVYVTVRDGNLHKPIIEHQRLNGFAELPLTASPDATGRAKITWTAISVDNDDRRCGRGALQNLENDATVNVHADTSC